MKKNLIFYSAIFVVFLLIILPVLSAECPAGFICGGSDIEISIPGGVYCSSDGRNWNDYSDISNPKTYTTLGLGNCYEPDALEEKFCCPAGSICSPTGESGPDGELYNCEYTEKDFCWKLDNENECEDYTKWVAINSIESIKGEGYCGVNEDSWWDSSGETCWNEISCSCEWDSATENCTAVDTENIFCSETGKRIPENGDCEYTIESWEEKCDEDGLIYASWISEGTGVYGTGGAKESECIDTGIRTIPCEQIVKLGFFSIFNIIAVILILIIAYYFYAKCKKKR